MRVDNMNNENDCKLEIIIENAARKAIKSLFNEYRENFYYCSLITDGEGHCPIISAWSEEALEKILLREKNPFDTRLELKWSYADSPYYAYGEEFFSEVNKVFNERMRLLNTEDARELEFNKRINAMEKAMSNLDKEGIFGIGEKRLKIVINAEVMPPDYSNTERALRLNPREALNEWLDEIAEEE